MALPGRINAVTLVCRDIGRMAAFYRQFGWPEAPTSVAEHVVFQCSNGVVLGLFSETVYEQYGDRGDSFGGFTLTIHCADEETVDRAYEEVTAFDDVVSLDAKPTRSGWGYGFGFRDPEGNVWGVALKYGSELDEHGRFSYP